MNYLSVVCGRRLSLNDIRGAKGTLIMFICNHCPFVIHIQKALVDFATDYKDGIGVPPSIPTMLRIIRMTVRRT